MGDLWRVVCFCLFVFFLRGGDLDKGGKCCLCSRERHPLPVNVLGYDCNLSLTQNLVNILTLAWLE